MSFPLTWGVRAGKYGRRFFLQNRLFTLYRSSSWFSQHLHRRHPPSIGPPPSTNATSPPFLNPSLCDGPGSKSSLPLSLPSHRRRPMMLMGGGGGGSLCRRGDINAWSEEDEEETVSHNQALFKTALYRECIFVYGGGGTFRRSAVKEAVCILCMCSMSERRRGGS